MPSQEESHAFLKNLLQSEQAAHWELALRIIHQRPDPEAFLPYLDKSPRKLSLCFQIGLFSL
ncbi:MAG: hypothetical protein AAFU64_14280, partial [Bacteroidota bacterium]